MKMRIGRQTFFLLGWFGRALSLGSSELENAIYIECRLLPVDRYSCGQETCVGYPVDTDTNQVSAELPLAAADLLFQTLILWSCGMFVSGLD